MTTSTGIGGGPSQRSGAKNSVSDPASHSMPSSRPAVSTTATTSTPASV